MAKSKYAVAADRFNAMLGQLFAVGGDGILSPYKGEAAITAEEIKNGKKGTPYPALASSYPGPDAGVYRACETLVKQGWTGVQPFGTNISRLLFQWLRKNNIQFLVSMKQDKEYVMLADKKAVASILK